jgi:hypothetical protein
MSDTKDIYVNRDPDSQLNAYDTVKVIFNASEVVTAEKAIMKAAPELDLPADRSIFNKFQIFVDGVLSQPDRILQHNQMILLKQGVAKDNG